MCWRGSGGFAGGLYVLAMFSLIGALISAFTLHIPNWIATAAAKA